jgi:hypothetical protein
MNPKTMMFRCTFQGLALTLTLAFAGSFFAQKASAQDYNGGIGLRGGSWGGSLDGKFFVNDVNSFRVLVGGLGRYDGYWVAGLYEVNKPTSLYNVNWYYGGGAHIGAYREFRNEGKSSTIGIDGMLGAEWIIPDIPFTLGVDIRPFFDFGWGGVGLDPAFVARVRF